MRYNIEKAAFRVKVLCSSGSWITFYKSLLYTSLPTLPTLEIGTRDILLPKA